MLTRRRLVWSLLRLDRAAEALEAAEALAEAAPTDWLSQEIAAAARRYATLDDAGEAAALVAQLPLFTHAQASRLMSGVVPAEPAHGAALTRAGRRRPPQFAGFSRCFLSAGRFGGGAGSQEARGTQAFRIRRG